VFPAVFKKEVLLSLQMNKPCKGGQTGLPYHQSQALAEGWLLYCNCRAWQVANLPEQSRGAGLHLVTAFVEEVCSFVFAE
jgi:hypothetical protein